jgi:transcriptional regulator with XRE-family HTH domain
MARWKDGQEYTPFAMILVEYMWAERPPLLPSQFAARVGVPKQVISKWLNAQAVPDITQMARIAARVPISLQQMCLAAGITTADAPILSVQDAWEYLIARVRAAKEIVAEERETALQVLVLLQGSDG